MVVNKCRAVAHTQPTTMENGMLFFAFVVHLNDCPIVGYDVLELAEAKANELRNRFPNERISIHSNNL